MNPRCVVRTALMVITLIGLVGCIRVRVHDTEALGITRCQSPESAQDRWTVFFGRETPDGSLVSTEAWQAFLDDTATAKLPDGFTWQESQGQWRDSTGRIWREPGFVLIVIAESAKADVVAEVSAAYRTRFAQQAVLRERVRVCTTLDAATTTPETP